MSRSSESVFSNVSSVVSMFNCRVHLIRTYQLTLTCKLDFTSWAVLFPLVSKSYTKNWEFSIPNLKMRPERISRRDSAWNIFTPSQYFSGLKNDDHRSRVNKQYWDGREGVPANIGEKLSAVSIPCQECAWGYARQKNWSGGFVGNFVRELF